MNVVLIIAGVAFLVFLSDQPSEAVAQQSSMFAGVVALGWLNVAGYLAYRGLKSDSKKAQRGCLVGAAIVALVTFVWICPFAEEHYRDVGAMAKSMSE